jgi:hypothetical protein
LRFNVPEPTMRMLLQRVANIETPAAVVAGN